jgi:hypothetical protein
MDSEIVTITDSKMVKKTGQPPGRNHKKVSSYLALIALENTPPPGSGGGRQKERGLDYKNREKHVRRETYKKGITGKSSGTSD